MTTQTVSTKWMIEIYSPGVSEPVSTDSIEKGLAANIDETGGVDVIIGSGTDFKPDEFLKGIFNGEDSDIKINTEFSSRSYGLVSMNLNRTKQSPDSNCSIRMVGPIPQSISTGNWVVVSSFDSISAKNNDEPIVRFVGQIETVNVSYTSTSDSNLVTNTNVIIREWSTILTTAYRFDINSAYATQMSETLKFSTLAAKSGVVDAVKVHSEFLKNPLNPFEFAHLILLRMGLMSAVDVKEKSPGKNFSISPYTFSMIPPSIPNTLKKRLRIKPVAINTSEAESGSFATGFVKVVSGIKNPSIFSSGNWDGFFTEFGGTLPDPASSIEGFSKQMEKNYNEIRKVKFYNATAMAWGLSGVPVWQVISSNIEPTVNEIFTDIWYERLSDGRIRSQPVIVIRDKPFALGVIVKSGTDFINQYSPHLNTTPEEIQNSIMEEWSLYDDLPRIGIPESSIIRASFDCTFLTSPNYFISNLNTDVTRKGLNSTESMVDGRILLKNHQRRFGGQELSYEVKYFSPFPATTSLEKLFGVYSELQRIWNSYLYRMPSCQLTIKNSDVVLSVGFNVQFKVGYFTLVGHISSYTHALQIDGDGAEITTTTINLERVVSIASYPTEVEYIPINSEKSVLDAVLSQIDKGNKKIGLAPLPQGAFNRLFDEQYHAKSGYL